MDEPKREPYSVSKWPQKETVPGQQKEVQSAKRAGPLIIKKRCKKRRFKIQKPLYGASSKNRF
jgi:hypothetical protein